MKKLSEMTREELLAFRAGAQKKYDEFAAAGLKINMARGKPCPEQLDLSNEILSLPQAGNTLSESGDDCRNYGMLLGIPECRRLFGELLGVKPGNVIVGGNASLTLMYDYISQCMTDGAGAEPWCRQGEVKFIAVVPGYDRHFSICEHFGIKMINVPIGAGGPDMDIIEDLIKDPSVKGMVCVPKYSNPDGITYSPETVTRLAKMKPAAADFRVIWDNAYLVHDLYDTTDELANILEEAAKYGNEDNFIVFASTSKMTFPGAGVAALAASDKNIAAIDARMQCQIISYDKVNQLRHVQFFRNADGIKAQMRRHAAIIRPKFETVLGVLKDELGGLGIASWNEPRGGYFISLYVDTGSAAQVGRLCKAAGLTLTNVGATYPYGKDPDDRNIRIAPTYPDVDTLRTAAALLCTAVRLAAADELLA